MPCEFTGPVLGRVFPSRFMLEQLIPQPEFAFFGLLASHALLSYVDACLTGCRNARSGD